jgi:DNA polymerase III epsilon subunit-like protein
MDYKYTFPKDIMIFDLETTSRWPEDGGKISEFGCVILDKHTLEKKDLFHVYVKIDQEDYDNSSDFIKEFHKDRWDYYLGKSIPQDRVAINQDQLVPLLIEKFGEYKNLLTISSWNLEFDFSWLRHYFYIYNQMEFFDKVTYNRFDLKSLFTALMIFDKRYSFDVRSKTISNLFGVAEEVAHDALIDSINESDLFVKFCELSA